MFTSKKAPEEVTLVNTSILAIGAGVILNSVFPAFGLYSGLMILSGITGLAYHFKNRSRFDRLWKNLNLCKGAAYPVLKEKERTDTSVIYKFSVPAGLSIEDFDRHKSAISMFLGRDIDIRPGYKEVWIEVYNQNEKEVYPYEVTTCKGNLEIIIGYDRRGRLITCDLSKGEPHVLIAGETGSGKSTILRAIITNLILTGDVKLHLIDLKRGAEFQIFSRCKQVVNFGRTRSDAERILNEVSEEIDRRYDLFQAKDCVDIKEYNKRFGGMGYEVLIVDEFADLQSCMGSIALLEDICARARACGIHVIISTQRPDHRVLNGRIKANVTTVIGLKTTNEINSRIIIDDAGLESLRGRGQGIFRRGTHMTLVQCPYLSTEKARELLRPQYVEKKTELVKTNEDITDFDFLGAL